MASLAGQRCRPDIFRVLEIVWLQLRCCAEYQAIKSLSLMSVCCSDQLVQSIQCDSPVLNAKQSTQLNKQHTYQLTVRLLTTSHVSAIQ